MVLPRGGGSAARGTSLSSPRSKVSLPSHWIILFLAIFGAGCWVGRYTASDVVVVVTTEQLSSSLTTQTRSALNTLTTSSSKRTLGQSNASLTSSAYHHGLSNSNGWHSIQVFYGVSPRDDDDDNDQNNQKSNKYKWFSQARQDELIAALFRYQKGGGRYFVDLAANDATTLSNTYALERYFDWTGLCIEPNPQYWYNLSTLRPSCQVIGAVVGRERLEQVHFRFQAGDHGGIAGDGFDNGKRWQATSDLTYTVTLLEILQRTNAPFQIDYLSLDVEGAESFIMMNFPLDRYHIQVITAERLRGPIRAYLKQHGFEFIARLTKWGESLWIHKSAMAHLDLSVLDRFDFPIQTTAT